MSWVVVLVLALLALLVAFAAHAAERMSKMAGELDALNTELQRTVTLVDRVIAAQANVVPAAQVQAAADALKAQNDRLDAAVPPA